MCKYWTAYICLMYRYSRKPSATDCNIQHHQKHIRDASKIRDFYEVWHSFATGLRIAQLHWNCRWLRQLKLWSTARLKLWSTAPNRLHQLKLHRLRQLKLGSALAVLCVSPVSVCCRARWFSCGGRMRNIHISRNILILCTWSFSNYCCCAAGECVEGLGRQRLHGGHKSSCYNCSVSSRTTDLI